MTDAHISRVRDAIVGSLSQLNASLGDFEQTTHGLIGGGSIFEVADRLVKAWQEPSAYNLSSLSQTIELFEKIQTHWSRTKSALGDST